MAHWISSKLKVAENFLHQIDQQAAESLGKNEQPQPDELGSEASPKTTETKPIKDQLKKKLTVNDDLIGKSRSDRNSNLINNKFISSSSNTSISSSISSSNNNNNNNSRDKEVGVPVNSLKPSGSNITDSDWTELLSAPSKSVASAVVRSGNGVSGVRGLRKDGRRQGSSGSVKNLSALDGKRSQSALTGGSRSVRKSDVQLDSKANMGVLDGKTSDSGEVTPTSSSVDLRSDGENQERSDLDGEDKGVKLVSESKNEEEERRNEELASARLRDQLGSQDDSADRSRPLVIASAILGSNLDLKTGMKGNESLKSAVKGVDKSVLESRSSVSIKKGSSPSDEESDSETDSTSSSDSESEHEREERRKRRQQILAEKAAVKAVEAIKERENTVARLEGEKQSLEKILELRAKQHVQEASELQSTMMEIMEAVELEKQKHNDTRMEALTRLAKLETTNANLAKSLATAQWNLELEVNRVADLCQQIELKEATHEDLRRKISSTRQSGDKVSSKGIQLEREILEAEYSFVTDKVGRLHDTAITLEASIESTRRELENPTEVEVELKRRLGQLTDHLIQKQAQVEALSSEKATLMFKIEAVSRSLDESKATMASAGLASTSSRDLESGLLKLSDSSLRPLLEERIRSGQQHLGSLVRQLDSIFCAGVIFLRRNSTARIWSLVYLVCLHLWVIYILSSHSSVSDEATSGAVVSLQNFNNTGGI